MTKKQIYPSKIEGQGSRSVDDTFLFKWSEKLEMGVLKNMKNNIYMCQRKERQKMISNVQKAFPACVRSVKRGDVYYADFGSVEDAVGHELAKKRPVLIIQNNLGNKKSSTTICLCLSTKCKYGLPYHVHFSDLSVVSRESDICAEQIKTIDQCRL